MSGGQEHTLSPQAGGSTSNSELRPPTDAAPPKMATPRRSVSFGLDDGSGAGSSSAAASGGGFGMLTPPVTSTPGAGAGTNGAGGSGTVTPNGALRSAMKPHASAYRKLPPAEQYQHTDPLVRRLRLVDERGNPINLKRHFGPDVKCIGFYFSSQWAGQPLKEYHKTITNFCMRHPHEFKVIYVSVDVDEQWYKAGVKGKPWVSMVWDDGSSPPVPASSGGAASGKSPSAGEEGAGKRGKPQRTGSVGSTASNSGAETEPAVQLYNGEDFLLGGEPDIDESLSHSDTSGEAYLRPFSRVHLASKLNIIAAPTLCVYHLPTGRMLDWNVRMTKLKEDKEQQTWDRWASGEKTTSASLIDACQERPFTIIMLVFSIIYYATVRLFGNDYNFLQKGMLAVVEAAAPHLLGPRGGGGGIREPIATATSHADL